MYIYAPVLLLCSPVTLVIFFTPLFACQQTSKKKKRKKKRAHRVEIPKSVLILCLLIKKKNTMRIVATDLQEV
jgi:hypothetical protein